MAEASKDTIYIDVDDEITNIIDKVKGSDKNIVALVLPKRAAVLQSIVNMKLLKRTANSTKKKVVLITSEAGLLPLAGATGMYVAKNLQSMPEIPEAPENGPGSDDTVIDGGELGDDDKEKTVGELAGATAVAASKADKASKKGKGKKGGKFKVPNFEKFRLKLFLIIFGVLAFFGLLYWAFFVAPSAKVTVFTDTSTINESFTFTASDDASTVNVGDKVVPAKTVTKEEVKSQDVAATGSKDVGEKATGTLSMTAKNCSGITAPKSVEAGTGVTANGQTYITQETASFVFESISGGCVNFESSASITAQQPGSNYNTGSTSFKVLNRNDVTAEGSASGGTDKTVKVVSKSDVNTAAENLKGDGEDSAKDELTKELQDDGYYVLESSFVANDPQVSSSPSVGSQASQATVTATTTYTLRGIKQEDLDKLIKAEAKSEIDTSKEQVVNTGLDEASFNVNGDSVSIDTIVTTGPTFDVAAVTESITGKKSSEVQSIILENPGVTDVKVDFSPFWVNNTPKKTEKIEIVFEDTSSDDE